MYSKKKLKIICNNKIIPNKFYLSQTADLKVGQSKTLSDLSSKKKGQGDNNNVAEPEQEDKV